MSRKNTSRMGDCWRGCTRSSSCDLMSVLFCVCFFFQAEDGIRDTSVTGVLTCALPILHPFAISGRDAAGHFPVPDGRDAGVSDGQLGTQGDGAGGAGVGGLPARGLPVFPGLRVPVTALDLRHPGAVAGSVPCRSEERRV